VSADDTSAGGSRQTNPNKCETGGSASETPESDSATERDVPTPEDAFFSVFESISPELLNLPVATQEGTAIREDYVTEELEDWQSAPLYYCGKCQATFAPSQYGQIDHVTLEHGPELEASQLSPRDAADAWIREKRVTGQRVADVDSVSWIEAVGKLLDSHERTRETTINLRYGRPSDRDFAKLSFSASDRWSPEYQQEMYAQCQGWLRELTGGSRPSGGDCQATFENPSVAFLTRSASAVPKGDRLGPIDHAARLRDPWREVYQSIRYTLDRLGFDKDEYQYWRVLEPHPGDGLNRAYAHEHIILVVDGQVSQSDLAPIMETHISATEGAGESAHTNTPCQDHAGGNPWDAADGQCDDCDTPLSVRDPETVESLAAYVADYASIDPVDLFDRPPEYIAWAAAITAGNIRSVSRSDPAGWAADADRCKQRYEHGGCDQEVDHGEEITTSNKGSNRVECLHCGSPHGIDQTRSIAAHRLDSESADEAVLADGGSRELWDEWVAAWRALEPTTLVRECHHEEPNQCPLCAEYVGAVDASVPIPDDAYVPDDAWENPADEYVDLIERTISRYSSITPPAVLGKLQGQLPEQHAEALVRGVFAGFDRPDLDDPDDDDLPDWRTEERIPEWHVHSITIDGEVHLASAGNGVTMTEVRSCDGSWDNSRMSDEPDWRKDPFADPSCNECDSGTYDLEGSVVTRSDDYYSVFICDSCGHEQHS
jgi:hypothetical protein